MEMELDAQKFIEKMMLENEEIKLSEIMVEFARMHVRAALASAHNAAIYEFDGRCWSNIYDRKFILSAYHEERVK
jgi:hypothetical protein